MKDTVNLNTKDETVLPFGCFSYANIVFFLLQDFLTTLVCNLLEEGNTLFKDGEWDGAVREFSEGLNVSFYAAADDVPMSEVLLESLYVNRAAAYYSMVRQRLFFPGLMQRLKAFIQETCTLFNYVWAGV